MSLQRGRRGYTRYWGLSIQEAVWSLWKETTPEFFLLICKGIDQKLHSLYQFSSVTQSCPTLCDPMDCSTPGLPVHHQLPELTQTHVHRVSEAIHHLILCHPLLLPPSIFPSIRVFSNESLLHIRWPKYGASVSASVLPMNIQDWSPLGWTGCISLQSKGLSRVFSNTTVQKHQLFGAQLSL